MGNKLSTWVLGRLIEYADSLETISLSRPCFFAVLELLFGAASVASALGGRAANFVLSAINVRSIPETKREKWYVKQMISNTKQKIDRCNRKIHRLSQEINR